ncbi:hypothetical protein SLA2020_490680 [Shorea laevis]
MRAPSHRRPPLLRNQSAAVLLLRPLLTVGWVEISGFSNFVSLHTRQVRFLLAEKILVLLWFSALGLSLLFM